MQSIIRNLLTALMAFLVVLFCGYSQVGLLPSVLNKYNGATEEIQDGVTAQCMVMQRAAQYQKRQSEKPETRLVRLAAQHELSHFELAERRLDAFYINLYTERAPPAFSV